MDDWDGATRTQLLERVRTGLLMAPPGLTLREADICAHVAMGYGALAVSLLLGISIHTVHTHRKRAYRKLGVSSQTELFNSVLRACLSRI
jgi:DNA-binding CsgD family transcriptional regulator